MREFIWYKNYVHKLLFGMTITLSKTIKNYEKFYGKIGKKHSKYS